MLADASKAFVLQAIGLLVDDELAEWRRAENGELELHLVTGDVFSITGAGISSMLSMKRHKSATFAACSAASDN